MHAVFNSAMAPAADGPARPQMRRKSSAQNFFKASNATTGFLAQPPPSAIATSPSAFGPLPTPPTAGMQREWDVQSLQSDSTAAPSMAANGTPLQQGTSVEMLREVVKKRIITLTYLRNVHEGCVLPLWSPSFLLG